MTDFGVQQQIWKIGCISTGLRTCWWIQCSCSWPPSPSAIAISTTRAMTTPDTRATKNPNISWRANKNWKFTKYEKRIKKRDLAENRKKETTVLDFGSWSEATVVALDRVTWSPREGEYLALYPLQVMVKWWWLKENNYCFNACSQRHVTFWCIYVSEAIRCGYNTKWFEPRSISSSSCAIVQVRVVLIRTVVGDWCLVNLSGSHLHSQGFIWLIVRVTWLDANICNQMQADVIITDHSRVLTVVFMMVKSETLAASQKNFRTILAT